MFNSIFTGIVVAEIILYPISIVILYNKMLKKAKPDFYIIHELKIGVHRHKTAKEIKALKNKIFTPA